MPKEVFMSKTVRGEGTVLQYLGEKMLYDGPGVSSVKEVMAMDLGDRNSMTSIRPNEFNTNFNDRILLSVVVWLIMYNHNSLDVTR